MKVRDVLRQLREDGWFLTATRGSHRQMNNPAASDGVPGNALLSW
ncbi:MAG TPA: hypothetical protein VGC20_17940 [bacterium]|jgi:predicted RNA binding protein YcfA (HicA-like mRNA interferase family)